MIYRAQSKLKKAISAEVNIFPKYPEETFSSDYLPQIVKRLKEEGYVVNGIFEGASSDFIDGKLTIYLSHGGKIFLDNTTSF